MLDTLNWSYDSEFSLMLLPMFIIYIYSVLLLIQRNIANLVHKWHQDDQIICSSHSPDAYQSTETKKKNLGMRPSWFMLFLMPKDRGLCREQTIR